MDEKVKDALAFLRANRTNEEIERLTGLSLADILSRRASLATPERRLPKRDLDAGRRNPS